VRDGGKECEDEMRWALLFVYIYSFTVSSFSLSGEIDGMRWDGIRRHGMKIFRFLYSHDGSNEGWT
jgi:hypothetical protein